MLREIVKIFLLLFIILPACLLRAAHGQSLSCAELRDASPESALTYLAHSRADVNELPEQICVNDALEKVRPLALQEAGSEIVRFLGFRDPNFFSIRYRDRYPAVDILSEAGVNAFSLILSFVETNEPSSLGSLNAGRVLAKVLDRLARKENREEKGYLAATEMLEREAAMSTGLSAERLYKLALRLRNKVAAGESPYHLSAPAE